MGTEAIMLSKTYTKPSQLILPCIVTEKLDGVPGDFYGSSLGYVNVRSRQNEFIHSVEHIQKWLEGRLREGHHIIGELYILGRDFKDISGLVRRKTPDEETRELVLYVFDYYIEGEENMTYEERMRYMAENVFDEILPDEEDPIRIIPGKYCSSSEEVEDYIKLFTLINPEAEGVVIRAVTGEKSVYKAGWRSPGMLKRKITETIDLEIVGFEEAVDKNGDPKGMVGRIICRYHTGASSDGNNEYTDYIEIGAGPGKMSHKERIDVFKNKKKYIGRIAEIAYMPDPSYEALREPRFYRWRDDKISPNQE